MQLTDDTGLTWYKFLQVVFAKNAAALFRPIPGRPA